LNAFKPGWAPESIWRCGPISPRVASPYDFNPLNVNPLKEVLDELVDFERVRACKIELFIGATNVETGRIRIFKNAELTADHVMASACLPQLFQAVMIDGQPYWDGGYTGNPALFPLFSVDSTRDIVIVQINPLEREGAPRSPVEITARVAEINFNANLLSELRAIEFVGAYAGSADAAVQALSQDAGAQCQRRHGADATRALASISTLIWASSISCSKPAAPLPIAGSTSISMRSASARPSISAAMFRDEPTPNDAKPLR
jgi:predicted acylesterase/phospholipase RssA